MWCPSCIYFYDEVQHLNAAVPVPPGAEFLVEQAASTFAFTLEARRAVSLHYHVQNDPRRREGQAGRRPLAAVPGLTVVAVEPEPRYGRTCTPACQGPPRARRLGPDGPATTRARPSGRRRHVAAIYHGCQRLRLRLRGRRPRRLRALPLGVRPRLGIEFEDTYKKHRLWADPERILADVIRTLRAGQRAGPGRGSASWSSGPSALPVGALAAPNPAVGT